MPTVKNVLIAGGVNFTNGFVTTPLCCPSRSSILSGEYVHNHQVYTNRMPLGGAAKFKDASTIATWMKDAGYTTAYYGKYLNDYEDIEPQGSSPRVDEGCFFKNLIETKIKHFNISSISASENGEIVEYPQQGQFQRRCSDKESRELHQRCLYEPFVLLLDTTSCPYVPARATVRPSAQAGIGLRIVLRTSMKRTSATSPIILGISRLFPKPQLILRPSRFNARSSLWMTESRPF
jgi:hypothetical protein